jgi:hypothetical protein
MTSRGVPVVRELDNLSGLTTPDLTLKPQYEHFEGWERPLELGGEWECLYDCGAILCHDLSGCALFP